jgi:hypothetical protein
MSGLLVKSLKIEANVGKRARCHLLVQQPGARALRLAQLTIPAQSASPLLPAYRMWTLSILNLGTAHQDRSAAFALLRLPSKVPYFQYRVTTAILLTNGQDEASRLGQMCRSTITLPGDPCSPGLEVTVEEGDGLPRGNNEGCRERRVGRCRREQ